MAKSVKNVIKDYKFETKGAKEAAKKCTTEPNSEYQVKRLCSYLDDAHATITVMATDTVIAQDVNKALRVDIDVARQKLTTSEDTIKVLKKEVKDTKGKVSASKDMVHDLQVSADELATSLNLKKDEIDKLKAKHSEYIIQKDKEFNKLNLTIDDYSDRVQNLQDTIDSNKANIEVLNEKIEKYENNWFVKMFLKTK